jgi:Mg-chelatase subunit ChlD
VSRPNVFSGIVARVLSLAIGLFAFISFQNCSKANFSASTAAAAAGVGPLAIGTNDDNGSGIVTQTGGANCHQELRSVTVPVKLVFVVDVSGSNVKNGKDPGTDPDKAVRGGSIERFFNSYRAKSNFFWNFITFADSSADAMIENANASSMQTTIDSFMAMDDSGSTPYAAALDKAKLVITDDSARAANTKYIVVFLSDGFPNPAISDSDINSKIQSVLNVVPGSISLNTIYYGQEDADASARLKMMAKTGGGNFLDVNMNPTGNVFSISDLVIIPGIVCN